jgi:hypothetical protein
MPLDEKRKHFTVFTVPGMGQFEWTMSPMGLLMPSQLSEECGVRNEQVGEHHSVHQ